MLIRHGEISAILTDQTYPRRVIPAGEAAQALGLGDAVTPDPKLAETVYEPLRQCLDDFETPLAGSEVLLDVSRAALRATESNAGNLVADSYNYSYDLLSAEHGLSARGPDNPVIGLQNGGGIRQNAGDVLPADGRVPGTLSRRNTLDVLAFQTNAVTVVGNVSPEQLKTILERSAASLPGQGGQFLQFANIQVVYDITRPAQQVSAPPQGETAGNVVVPGERVRRVVYTNGTAEPDDDTLIIVDGAVADNAPRSLRIVTNSFTADGGDNYPPFEGNQDKILFPPTYEQSWVSYLLSFPGNDIPTAQGTLRLPTVPANDQRYQPGGEGRIVIEQ